jgi:hypothetical protein
LVSEDLSPAVVGGFFPSPLLTSPTSAIKIKSRKERRGLPMKKKQKKFDTNIFNLNNSYFFSHVPIKRKIYLASNMSQFIKDIFVFVFDESA